MLKGTNRYIIALLALVLLSVPTRAQDEAYGAFSPYSMYGIGDVTKSGTAYNRSMGGVGVATRDKRNINILNPASVTERDPQSFMLDFSIAQGNRYYKQGDMKSSNNTFNLNSIALSFPVWKSFSMYAGFSPFSDIGYKITAWETDPYIVSKTGAILNTVQGYGGLSKVYIGGGFSPFKGFSIGGEGQYIFGSLHKDNTFTMSDASYRSISSGYTLSLNSFKGKFGVQYSFPVSNKASMVLGATYELGADLRGSVDRFEIQTISSINDSTPSPRTMTEKLSKGKVRLASEIGLGLALKGGDKWTAEVNYFRSDWTSTGMDKVAGFANVGNAVFSASQAQSVRAGMSFVPNRNDVRYYRKTITYRAGTYWDQAYCNINGKNLYAFGLTFGATLPVFQLYNGLTVGFDVGQRSATGGGLVRERYFNINIGLNVHDIWFIKQRYE